MADRRKKDNYKPMAPEDPVSGNVFLDQVLDHFDINLEKPETQIVLNWKTLVGEETAAHCRCDRVEKGIIYVCCDHPSRAAGMRLKAGEIIKNIRGVYPEINLSKIVTYIHK